MQPRADRKGKLGPIRDEIRIYIYNQDAALVRGCPARPKPFEGLAIMWQMSVAGATHCADP